MNGDLIKIIASVSKFNFLENERYNATGEKYLVVGEHDSKIGVVDEYGKVKELMQPIAFTHNGNNGEIKISNAFQSMYIKYGRVGISGTGDSITEHEILYDEPFPNACQSLIVTQNDNDQIQGFMAKVIDNTKFRLTVTGGRQGEEISYIAIGY